MQNFTLKKLVHLYIFLFLTVSAFGQTPDNQNVKTNLQTADSLFQLKRYTQAFEIYNKTLQESRYSSPSMLLKMAFIQEGLGNYSKALYFLNRFHLKTGNEAVLEKMEELADKHELQGYDLSDWDYVLTFYQRHHETFIFTLMAMIFLLFALMIYQKRKSGKRPLELAFFFVFLNVILVVMLNVNVFRKKAIINQDFTYLMNAPSAAGQVVEIVKPGHRAPVLDQQDVWVKIGWKDTTAYIKQHNVDMVD